MKQKMFAASLCLTVLVLIIASGCTFLSDEENQDFVGDFIEFDVGYDFFAMGYWIGFHPIYVPTGSDNSTVQYSPSGDGTSAFVSAIGMNSSFTKEYEFNEDTLAVEGTFTSSTECVGKTTYRGYVLEWTAVAE